MTDPTKREIERLLEALKREQPDDAPTNLTVEWREADPDERPTGIEYDPETETLYYDIWAAQRKCLSALDSGDDDIVAFLAGYGSGKSILGARWLLAQALTTPDSRFLAMGVDFTKARDTTFRILCEQLPGEQTALRTGSFNGPEQSPLVADYNASTHQLTLTNGSVIVLGSADKWSRYAGDEFGAIWLDEPSHYETGLHDLLEMLGSRLRGVDGPKTMCWTLTGNGFNDAWVILEKRRDSTGEPLGLEIELVRGSTLENPYLDAGDHERLERQFGDTERAEQALHGGFAAATGLVYDTFSRETHVIPHAEAAACVVDDWRVYGYDAGWDSPGVVLEIGKTPLDQLVVVDAFYETESHIEDAIEWLKDRPSGVIYCEHKPSHIDKLEEAGFDAVVAVKDIDEGIAEVRKRLEADGNLEVSTDLRPKKRTVRVPIMGLPDSRSRSRQSRSQSTETEEPDTDSSEPDTGEPAVGLLISERCQELIREFYGYKADHVGGPNADDHCLDALRYAVMGVATPDR